MYIVYKSVIERTCCSIFYPLMEDYMTNKIHQKRVHCHNAVN